MPTYTPLQPGIPKDMQRQVIYREAKAQSASVSCVWILFTPHKLQENFTYLVLPDGCIDIIFDVNSVPEWDGALIMTPGTTAQKLSLGTSFAYAGIRLQPGAWRGNAKNIIGESKVATELRMFSFIQAQQQLARLAPYEQLEQLAAIAKDLESQDIIGSNVHAPITQSFSTSNVVELAQASSRSRRHLQRLFRQATGFSPHAFIKITRLQQALRASSFDAYSDQSHYIRDCKKITGLTPKEFKASYPIGQNIQYY